MTIVTTDPLLAHPEQRIADYCRREFGQAENIWRCLPFFAATLALQVAGLASLATLASVFGVLVLVALVVLTSCHGQATGPAIEYPPRATASDAGSSAIKPHPAAVHAPHP